MPDEVLANIGKLLLTTKIYDIPLRLRRPHRGTVGSRRGSQSGDTDVARRPRLLDDGRRLCATGCGVPESAAPQRLGRCAWAREGLIRVSAGPSAAGYDVLQTSSSAPMGSRAGRSARAVCMSAGTSERPISRDGLLASPVVCP
jgi:hypothetical protein